MSEKYVEIDDIVFCVKFDYERGYPELRSVLPENCREKEYAEVDITFIGLPESETDLSYVLNEEIVFKIEEKILNEQNIN